MLPVVVIQHEESVPPGSIEEVLRDRDIEHDVFEAWRRTDWPRVEEVGALVVMGGTMNVDEIDDFPSIGSSRKLMAAALEKGVPTLGVCLGSQMMARLLGVDVVRAEPRNATFSQLEMTPEGRDDPVLAPFVTGTPVLQFHEDTFGAPDRAVVLAKSASSGLNQAFRYGDRAYAIQFHFEVDYEIIRGWCRAIGSQAMLDDWGVSEEDLMSQADAHAAAQETAGKELFTRFLKVVD